MRSQKIASMGVVLLFAAGCTNENPDMSCVEHTECEEDEICRSDLCYPAYGDDYVVHVTSARYIPAANPEGDFWDPAGEESGTEPDPYAVFFDMDGALCTTRHLEDTTSPTWGFRCPSAFFIDEDSRYGWSLYEDDEGPDDFKIDGTPEGEEFQILVEWIRDGEFSLQYDRVSITFSIEPR